MYLRNLAGAAVLAALAVAPGGAWAQTPPRESVAPAFRAEIPNVPGKSIVGAVVRYPPGGATPSHHHARSAFVTAYVLSGSIRSQVDGGPVRVFKVGESWTERPGAHHGISENASATEPAALLAIFVVDSDDTTLTTLDRQ